MSSKYDLLITIDQSTGINPGVSDRAYCPGQVIKGTVDLNVYEPLTVDQIQVSLLGFEETTYVQGTGRDPRIWKEKHIFLKHFRPILPLKPNRVPYKFVPDDNEHSSYEFLLPEFSTCETCRRVERLPPSMDEAQAVSGGKVLATASITYQVEVVVELKANGNIFFHEKFVVHPLATVDSNGYNDIKRNYVYGERVFRSKLPDGISALRTGQKKSLFRLMFSSSSSGSSKAYNIPLKIGIRPEDSYVKIIQGRNVNVPPTSFLFEYLGSSLSDPPLISSRDNTSTKLGQFVIKSLKVSARYPYIKTFCAGHDGSVQSNVTIYVNNTLNVPFDIGSEFKYNSSTNTFQKEMLLVDDIVGHLIDIPLDSYQAEFPLHCNHIARKKGALEFSIGLVHASDLEAKPEFIIITVPFEFRGVEDEFQPPSDPLPNFSDLNIQAPAGPPPGDYKLPAGPPPSDYKLPSGHPGDYKLPSGHPGDYKSSSGASTGNFELPSGPPPSADHKAPLGPPHGHEAPSGPPPGHSDYGAPTGPPPAAESEFVAPIGPPPSSSNPISAPLRQPTEPLIDLDSTDEVPPSYTEVKK